MFPPVAFPSEIPLRVPLALLFISLARQSAAMYRIPPGFAVQTELLDLIAEDLTKGYLLDAKVMLELFEGDMLGFRVQVENDKKLQYHHRGKENKRISA